MSKPSPPIDEDDDTSSYSLTTTPVPASSYEIEHSTSTSALQSRPLQPHTPTTTPNTSSDNIYPIFPKKTAVPEPIIRGSSSRDDYVEYGRNNVIRDSDARREYSYEDVEGDDKDDWDCMEVLRGCWYFLSVLGLLVALGHLIAAGIFSEVKIGGLWRNGFGVGGGWKWGFGLGIAAIVVGAWMVITLILGWFAVKGKGGSVFLCVWVLMCVIGLLALLLLAVFCLAMGFGWRRDGLRDVTREAWKRDVNDSKDACEFEKDFKCRGFFPNDCFPGVEVPGEFVEGGGEDLCPNCENGDDSGDGLNQVVLKQGCFRALTRFLKVWYLVIGFLAVAVILLLIPYFIVIPMMLGLR